MVNVLLVDDHPILRAGLKSLVNSDNGYAVVGEANTGREAVKLAQELKPDIVVMDISMPDMNGAEATLQIKNIHPKARIIILTVHSERHIIDNVLKAGASGYLLKDCISEDLLLAIKTVLSDQVFLSPRVARTLVQNYVHQYNHKDGSIFSDLTAREREILQAMAEGKSVKQIAADFFLSIKTVGAHRKNIMDKLQIRNVPDLVKYALREGIIDLD